MLIRRIVLGPSWANLHPQLIPTPRNYYVPNTVCRKPMGWVADSVRGHDLYLRKYKTLVQDKQPNTDTAVEVDNAPKTFA